MKKCSIKNCQNKYLAVGLCSRHWSQKDKYGKILERTRFDPNEFIDRGDYFEILLCNRKMKIIGSTLIDKINFDKVRHRRWCRNSQGYVTYRDGNKIIRMHRIIIGTPPKGMEVDHINGNKLDNRGANLRFVTRSQNNMNRKDVKGYWWDKIRKKWAVAIHQNNKKIHLGRFNTEQEAIDIRHIAKLKYFGKFASK